MTRTGFMTCYVLTKDGSYFAGGSVVWSQFKASAQLFSLADAKLAAGLMHRKESIMIEKY